MLRSPTKPSVADLMDPESLPLLLVVKLGEKGWTAVTNGRFMHETKKPKKVYPLEPFSSPAKPTLHHGTMALYAPT